MNKKKTFIFKQALALFMVLCSVWGWGQLTLPSGTSYVQDFDNIGSGLPLGWSVRTGATANLLGTDASFQNSGTDASLSWSSTSGNFRNSAAAETPLTSSSTPAVQYSAQDRAIGLRQTNSFGDPGAAIMLEISNTTGKKNFSMNVKHMLMDVQSRTTTYTVQYTTVQAGNSGWKNLGTFSTNGSWGTTNGVYSFGSALDNISNTVRIRIIALSASNGSNSRDTYGIDDFQLTWENIPTCTTAGFSFADGNTISKTTTDAPFTNTFESNNTSPKTYSSNDESVATVSATTGEVTIVGPGSATITIKQVADATFCAVSASYTLNVTSAAPSLAISGTANHGPVCTGTPASVQTYTVTNTGNSAAGGLSVTSDNPQFVVSNISSTTVNGVNGTVTFDVTFTPAAAGAQNATLTVTSTTSGSNTATYQITGTGNPTVAPAVVVGSADVTNDAATLHGNVTSLGSCLASNIVGRGFIYTVFSSPELNSGTVVTDANPANGQYSINVSGLVPAKTYYYKAFVVDALGQYYYSETESSFTTTLATPVATAATNVAPTSFTANWNSVTGAESYVLEVSEEQGGGVSSVLLENFNKFTGGSTGAGASSNDRSNVLDTYTQTPGWTGVRVYEAGGTGKMGSGSALGSLTTPFIDLSADSGIFTLNLEAMAWKGDSKNLKIYLNGALVHTITDLDNSDYSLKPYNISLTGGTANSQVKIEGNTASNSRFFLENLSIVQGGTVLVPIINNLNVGNLTSYSVAGLKPNSNYTYTVKAVSGSVTSAASNTIEVTTQGAPTWNGSAWSNTTGPDASTPAIIDGDYNAGEFTSQSLTVNAGKTLTVNNYVSAVDVTNNGNIIVADGGNFVQTGTFTPGAGSSFKVRKDTKPVKRLAYINWSSPMAGSTQTLKDFSYGKNPDGSNQSATGTVDNRFFTYKDNKFVSIPPTTTFKAGAGYQIRTPNDFTTTPQVFHGQFEGTTPNTGAISANNSGGNYVLLGNPYPSAISIDSFLTANPGTQETIYIWNSEAEMIDNGYGGGNYNTYAPNTGQVPAGTINGYIPVGQGFFIERGTATAPFVFNNAMRQTTQDGVFSKAATADKFWLELTVPSGSKPQMLIGFNAAATADYDAGFDAALFGTNADALYSEVNGTKLVIDAHGTFSSDDTFALKADLSAAGNYTIGILKSEGVFANGQQIWLKDQLTGTTTLISEQPYAFSADAGTLANRFVLQFKPGGALAADSAVKSDIRIYSAGSEVHAKSSENITSLHVYDMSGRMVAKAPAAQKEVVLNVAYKGVVLVKAQLANGTVKTTKLMLK